MSDVTNLALVIGAGASINAVYKIQQKQSPETGVIASAVMFAGLTVFGGLTSRFDIAVAIAWLFFLAALFMRGQFLVQGATSLVQGAAKPKVDYTKTANAVTGLAQSLTT